MCLALCKRKHSAAWNFHVDEVVPRVLCLRMNNEPLTGSGYLLRHLQEAKQILSQERLTVNSNAHTYSNQTME